MMKIYAVVALVILTSLAWSCSLPPRALTPQSAVRDYVLERESAAHAPKISVARRTPEDKLTVVYTFQRPTSLGNSTYVLGNVEVIQEPWPLWQVVEDSTSEVGTNTAPLKGQLLDYSSTQHEPGEPSGYTALYGNFLSENVDAVAAVQNDGVVVRDEGEDGLFALFSARGTIFCELHALDEHNQVLKRIIIDAP